jgi:hypothetical protein
VRARRLLKHAVATCLAVVALAGCGDGGAPPQSLPPLTQSPTATSPTPVATAPAAEDPKQSAERFIRSYFEEFDRANHNSDPSVLTRLYYDRNCVPCRDDVAVIERDRQRGHRVEGYNLVIHRVLVDEANPSSAVVNTVVHHRAGRIVRVSDGKVVNELRATKPVQALFDLRRVGTSWRITRIVSLGVVSP